LQIWRALSGEVHVGRSVVRTGLLFDVTPQDRGYSGQITVGVKRS
jgi:deoxycytidine triphosphate deaminase